MKIILDVPEHTMCVGIFVNYKSEEQYKDKTHPFTTTNCLINTEEYSGVHIDEDGTLYFKPKVESEGDKNV